MPNKLLLDLSNSFNAAKQNKLATIDVKFSRKVVNVVRVLLREGLIRGYFFKSKYNICVLLKYVDDENIVFFNKVSSVNQKLFACNNSFRSKFDNFNCCLISTRRGILSRRETLKNRLGGFLLLNVC